MAVIDVPENSNGASMRKLTYKLKNGDIKEKYYPQSQYNKTHYLKNRETYLVEIVCDVCNGKYTQQNKSKHDKTIKHNIHKKYNENIEKLKNELQQQQTQTQPIEPTEN